MIARRGQRGFTLAEMLLVVAILGVLTTIGVNQYRGYAENARAVAIVANAHRLADNWAQLAEQFGVAKTVTGNPLLKSNNGALDVILGGEQYVATPYQTRYRVSGLKPLGGLMSVTTAPVAGASAGSYAMEGYPVTLVTPDARTAQLRLSGVPSGLLEILWVNEVGSAFAADSAVASGPIQYTAAAADGTHTVTFEYSI